VADLYNNNYGGPNQLRHCRQRKDMEYLAVWGPWGVSYTFPLGNSDTDWRAVIQWICYLHNLGPIFYYRQNTKKTIGSKPGPSRLHFN